MLQEDSTRNVFESQISMSTQQLNNLQQSFENSILDIINGFLLILMYKLRLN